MKIAGYIFILLLAGVASHTGLAQTINTDRPTQSASAYVLPQGRLQWETGGLHQRVDDRLNFSVFNNSLIRYGVNDFFEMRFVSNYIGIDTDFGVDETGFAPFAVGFKSKIAEEKGFWPEVAFLGQIALPSGDSPFDSETVVPDFRVSMQHTLGGNASLGYNWGMIWSEGSTEAANLYTLVFSQGFANDFAWFIEIFGFIFEDFDDDHQMNAGFTYLLNDKIQFDLSGGAGLSDIAPDWFLGAGVSFAFIK